MSVNRLIKLTLPLILWVFMSTNALCTHIVGGEMNYTALGDDEYEISLTIFRDCFNGNPNAWFDDPAAIGIYNSKGELVDSLFIPLIGNDTLIPVLSDPCFVVPPSVCVHTTTYRAVKKLKPILGGYTLIYQRCCRNQTILNIVDPLDTGATFGVTISERALLEGNSNPKFKDWPPIYICVNEPIRFDQSAIDSDGDSISYKLCSPIAGANPEIPQPQPFQQRFADSVTWVSPPYGRENMLGGIPLAIDSKTGLLTGVPNTIGQFVVGVCVEEFRDGEMISTTRRDFQYNVGQCGRAVSSFFAPEIQCDGLEVNFNNESQNTSDFIWSFGDPEDPDFVSTEINPSYIFSDTGTYIVQLIAAPGGECTDTFIRSISLREATLKADFDLLFESCSDTAVIKVSDTTIDSVSNIEEWYWVLLNDGVLVQTSTEQNPRFVIKQSSDVSLELTATSTNGCAQTISKDFEVDLIEEKIENDSLTVCIGDDIILNATHIERYKYQWSPAIELNSDTIPNPIVTPSQTRDYKVSILDTLTGCQLDQQIHVFVPPSIQLSLNGVNTTCEEAIELNAITNLAGQFIWSKDPKGNEILGQEDSLIVFPIGEEQYFFIFEDSYGCRQIDSISVTSLAINIELEGDSIICLGQSPTIELQNLDVADNLSFQWQMNPDIITGSNSNTPTISPTTAGPKSYIVNVNNQHGCSLLDTISIFVLDTLPQDDFVSFQQCGGFTINFNNTGNNANYYQWNFGDPNNPDAGSSLASPSYSYDEVGQYLITLTLNEELPCTDTIYKMIEVVAPNINLGFTWEFEECTDSAVIQFTNLSTNSQSNFSSFQWEFSNGENSDVLSPEVIVTDRQTLGVQLFSISEDGCEDSTLVNIPINLVEEQLADTLNVCNGEPIALNPEPDENYKYEWSPDVGLNNPNSPNPLANPISDQVYAVRITDLGTSVCSIEREIFVQVPPSFEFSIPMDTMLCNSNFLLFADSESSLNYQWSNNAGFQNILSELPEFMAEVFGSQLFFVKGIDVFGCERIDSVLIENNEIEIAYPDQLSVCIGDTLRLSPQFVNDEQSLIFEWRPVDEIIQGAETKAPLVETSENGVFNVSVKNNFGCTIEDSILVSIFNFMPPLDLDAEPDTILLGESSQLTGTQSEDYSYLWMPDESLSDNNISTTVATPSETTLYTLKIRNEDGCANERSILIVVNDPICDEPNIFIPNAFTPNGDNENDVLFVRGNAIDEMQLFIFDRWGAEVFRSNSKSVGWDGTYQGKEVSPNVFGYYLEVGCINGEQYRKQGNITLLR